MQISLGSNIPVPVNPTNLANLEINIPKIPLFNLTNEGFHFVLQDTPTQVHKILQKYIIFIQNDFKDDNVTVELIKLIFNLALSEFKRPYSLKLRDSKYPE